MCRYRSGLTLVSFLRGPLQITKVPIYCIVHYGIWICSTQQRIQTTEITANSFNSALGVRVCRDSRIYFRSELTKWRAPSGMSAPCLRIIDGLTMQTTGYFDIQKYTCSDYQSPSFKGARMAVRSSARTSHTAVESSLILTVGQ